MKVRKSLLLGIVVLLVVDVLWVGSAGLTKYLFTQASYDKPFFTTYFKTSLFTIYLSAFIFWRPWQRLCWCEWRKRRRRRFGLAEEAGPGSCDQEDVIQQDETEVVGEEEKEGGAEEGGVAFGEGGVVVGGVEGERGGDVGGNESICADGHSAIDHGIVQCQLHQQQESHGSVVVTSVECEGSVNCGGSVECEGSVKCGGSGRPLRFTPRLESFEQCPLPRPAVCLLGPPETRPLCCDLSDLCELDREENQPCKGASNESRRFDRNKDCERYVKQTPVELLPVHRVAILSLVFGILWLFANYLYALALERTSVAIVNTLSASSGVFVMCLTAIPFLATSVGDRFTIPRCLVTLLSVAGAILVSLSPSGKDDNNEDENSKIHQVSVGALLALGGAILYALYLVLLRKMVKEPEALEIPMFFGLVGLFDFILLFPMLFILHYTNTETFEFPPTTNVWTLLLVNGFVGTVLSELLWLWGVFLTSPLVGTLALSLVTPLSITYSLFIGKGIFSWMFVLGAILIILGFVGVAILEHLGAWDPAWKGIKKLLSSAQNNPNRWSLESQQLLASSPELTPS